LAILEPVGPHQISPSLARLLDLRVDHDRERAVEQSFELSAHLDTVLSARRGAGGEP